MGRAVVSAPLALGMLVALFLCFAMQNLWRATFGPLLVWLGNLGISAGRGVFKIDVHPFRFALHANTAMERYFSEGVAMAERGFVRFLNYTVEPFLLMAGVTLALGLVGYEGLQALWHHVTRTAPSIARDTLWKPAAKALARVDAITRARLDTLTAKLAALSAHVAQIAATIPHAITSTVPRVGRLERQAIDYVKLPRWLKRGLLGALGATVVATALKRLGLGWARCTNVTKIGKRACGLDPSLIESLLADTLLVVGTLSLVEFAKEMESVTSEVAPLVGKFWRAV